MQLEDIRRCGRQILEALKTLQDKGFPYGILKIWKKITNFSFFISTIKFVKYILCLSGLCYHSVRSPAHWKYYHGRKCC
jgi:hypothetical protein